MPFESLYIHVPFCDSKCGYCAFYSTPVHDADLRQRYIRRIAEEIAGARSRFAPLRSIYIGGGTPSALTAEELKQLLSLATDATELKPTCEITVEANPESLATEKIAALSESGVTRVSLGIQSFDPTHRRTLQRQGTTDHLDRIVADLAAHGINRLNLDLIYAIPGQSCADFATDLGLALQYRATHVAAYALTIEEQTVLAAQNVQLGTHLTTSLDTQA
jgi:oxygen-independent coproporphyrinogen-3 oxidase